MSALRIVALPTPHRFRAGDDVAGVLLDASMAAGITLADGDVVCVASKVVSLAEGATRQIGSNDDVTLTRRALARRLAARIVADTPQVLVTRTQHGFVVANGGIDASNAPDGHLIVLPDDPDASATRLRTAIRDRTGVDVGIVVTDTFGRPWREGQTDVALGLAGVPAFRDERGSGDLDGRPLDVTQAAIADELAAAADLVRTKADGAAFVLVRGLPRDGARRGPAGADRPERPERPDRGTDLVRDVTADLFPAGGPTAAMHAIAARRTIRSFDLERPVPAELLDLAVAAAASAPAPHHSRPWRVIVLADETRTRLLDAMAERWRQDLAGDGLAADRIERRIARSDAILREAPRLLATFVVTDAAHDYLDERRRTAERDLFVLSAGAALQNLQIALSAYGLGAAWISSTAFCPDTVRAELDLETSWQATGMVAVGWPAGPPPSPRPPVDPASLLLHR